MAIGAWIRKAFSGEPLPEEAPSALSPPAPDARRIAENFVPYLTSHPDQPEIPEAAILALGRRVAREVDAAARKKHAPSLSPAWLARRIEELEASLEVASERLLRSLRRQSELETQAAADRAAAARAREAEAEVQKLRAELAKAVEASHAAQSRAAALEADQKRLESDIERLRNHSEEKDKNLSDISSRSSSERDEFEMQRKRLETKLEETERAKAAAEAEALSRRQEAERVSEHLALREKTLSDTLRDAQAERERLGQELSAARQRGEEQASAALRREAELREELSRLRAESDNRREEIARLERTLASEKEQATATQAELAQARNRLSQVEREESERRVERDALKGELARLETERENLSRLLKEREETFKEEITGGRQERDRRAAEIESARAGLEKLGREHEALLSKASRLESDLAQAAATGKEERERARGLAEQALAAEDKAKGLAAELEKLRARHSDTQQDREVLEKELAREREAGQRERAALQAKLDDLSERLRRAEREAGAAQAGQTAVLKRAEAAEGLVRQRLRLVSSQSTPGAVAAGGGVDQVTLEHLAALEDQSRRIEEQLARFEKQAGAQQPEPVSLRADLDKLAQVTQRIEDQIRTLSPATASPHHPAPALDPALRERLLTLEGQTDEIGKHLREVAALLSQPEKVPAGQEVLREELRRSAETQARELDTLKKKLDALAESSLAAGAPGPSRERPNWPLVAAIAGGILITLVGSLYLLIDFRLNRERRQLAQIFGAGPAAIAKPLPLPRLTRPEPDSLVKSERAALAGEAAGADAVFLFLNDSLYAVELVRGGKFSFESIPFEAGTTRVGLRSVGSSGAASDLWETSLVHPAPEGEAPAPFVRDLFRGDSEKRRISLTFDGDGAAGTEEVLEVLRAHNLKMTMFLTGGFIEERPDLAKKIVEGGHEVGNHLWDHPHLTTFDSNSRHDTRPNVTKAFFQGQLIRTASLFEEVTGKKMAPFWRAPFGEVNPELLRWAMELGYQHVNWTRDYSRNETLDSWDWVVDKNSHRYQTNDEIVRRLLSFGRTSESSANGGIVLMHLGTQRPAGDALHERLPNLIRGWQEQGYEFVKISQMTGKD